MHSFILLTMTRLLLPLLLLFSLFLLLRGHQLPGGGFVGGLVAAAGFSLLSLAAGVPQARLALRIDPITLAALGLLIAFASGVFGLLSNGEFLQASWFDQSIPLIGDLGTPLLFDVGVYCAVIGGTLTIIFNLRAGD